MHSTDTDSNVTSTKNEEQWKWKIMFTLAELDIDFRCFRNFPHNLIAFKNLPMLLMLMQ